MFWLLLAIDLVPSVLTGTPFVSNGDWRDYQK